MNELIYDNGSHRISIDGFVHLLPPSPIIASGTRFESCSKHLIIASDLWLLVFGGFLLTNLASATRRIKYTLFIFFKCQYDVTLCTLKIVVEGLMIRTVRWCRCERQKCFCPFTEQRKPFFCRSHLHHSGTVKPTVIQYFSNKHISHFTSIQLKKLFFKYNV